jgi:branched-chain amino acid transport system ATP-binding protein
MSESVAPSANRSLAVEGIVVRYGQAVAVDGVDLQVPPGGRIAVVGPNGAGKSTLLKAIAGLVPVAKGRIMWGDDDISRRKVHERVQLGITLVPEGRRVFPGMKVSDNLRVAGFTSPRNVAARRESVYELFPSLRNRSRIPAAQLSGGEAQMLAIGQALMAGPSIVLLDEPSLGLAPIAVQALLRAMGDLADSGISVLLVEQSVRLAMTFGESLYVLSRGKVRLTEAVSGDYDEEALRKAYFGGSLPLEDSGNGDAPLGSITHDES